MVLRAMCTLAIYFQVFATHPVILAANRDEFLARPTTPAGPLDATEGIYGGRDDRFGGTWFGVNRHGVAAALLNRQARALHPDRRSRGLLCLDALRQTSAAAARSWIRAELPGNYNPFNLLVTDMDQAWVATSDGGRLTIQKLERGLHLLTNLDVNDATCPRISASYRLFAELLDARTNPPDPAFSERLHAVLARHDTALDPRGLDPGNSLCVHAGDYGTRSSSIVYLDRTGGWTYLHSDQPPCRGQFRLERLFSAEE